LAEGEGAAVALSAGGLAASLPAGAVAGPVAGALAAGVVFAGGVPFAGLGDGLAGAGVPAAGFPADEDVLVAGCTDAGVAGVVTGGADVEGAGVAESAGVLAVLEGVDEPCVESDVGALTDDLFVPEPSHPKP
jgi:hypothetical protein